MSHFTTCGVCGKPLNAIGRLSKSETCHCKESSGLLDTGAAYLNYFGMAYEIVHDALRDAGKVERWVNGEKVE